MLPFQAQKTASACLFQARSVISKVMRQKPAFYSQNRAITWIQALLNEISLRQKHEKLIEADTSCYVVIRHTFSLGHLYLLDSASS